MSPGNCSLALSGFGAESEGFSRLGDGVGLSPTEALVVSGGNCILGPSECGASDGSCSQLGGGVRYPVEVLVLDGPGVQELSGRSSRGTVAAWDGSCSW